MDITITVGRDYIAIQYGGSETFLYDDWSTLFWSIWDEDTVRVRFTL